MTRGIKLVAVAAGLAALLGTTSSSATTKSEDYAWGQGDYAGFCAGETIAAGVASPVNQGAACFRWSGSKTSVKVTFNDLLSGGTVGFYWQWYDAQDGFLTGDETDPVTGEPEAIYGNGCGPKTIAVPAGARGIRIWLDQVYGSLDCSIGAGFASTGTVTIEY